MNIENKLIQYELDLLDSEFTSCQGNIERRIDKDFFEISADGSLHNRESVIPFLSTRKDDQLVTKDSFNITEIGKNTFLLNYETRNTQKCEHLLRTSIWTVKDESLKIIFHQSTIIQPKVELS